MAVSLDIEVVLLDIGRFVPPLYFGPLSFKMKVMVKGPVFPAPVTCIATELILHVEGTVCPISFVKDVLVSNLSSPSTCCFRVGNCTPRDTSFPCTTVLPDSDHRDPDQIQKTVQCIICKCRWVRQHSCNRASSMRSLWSMMGHLELHKCCDLEEAFFDSPPQWLLSFFCMSCPDTRAREGTRGQFPATQKCGWLHPAC
jgi:hypothetical protein